MSGNEVEALRRQRNGRAVEERLRWIDAALRWEGGFRRHEAAARFGVSESQVSADVAHYNRIGTGHAIYNYQQRLFRAASGHAPAFEVGLAEWLQLREGGQPAVMEALPSPEPALEEDAVRAILLSLRRQCACEVASYSEARGAAQMGVFHPHSLFADGPLWFARGWDETRRGFADLCLAHVLEARLAERRAWIPVEADEAWATVVRLPMVANPALPHGRRFVVEREWGLRDGRVILSLRRALVGRYLERVGLLTALVHGTEPPASVSLWPEDPRQALEWAITGGFRRR